MKEYHFDVHGGQAEDDQGKLIWPNHLILWLDAEKAHELGMQLLNKAWNWDCEDRCIHVATVGELRQSEPEPSE